MDSPECSESSGNVVPIPEVPPPQYSNTMMAADPSYPPPSYLSLFAESSTDGNVASPGVDASFRFRELDARDLMQQTYLRESTGLDRDRASTTAARSRNGGPLYLTDVHSTSTTCERKDFRRYADILFLVTLFLLNILAFGLIVVLRYQASRSKNDGKKSAARRLMIASYLVGLVGILATIGLICWGVITDRCELIGYLVNGNCFRSVNHYNGCSTVTCCTNDSILYKHSCYGNPEASFSPTCRYIAYWTCYSDRRYYGSCESGRCCLPYETYYANYCNFNTTSATESSVDADRCRYSINGTCHAHAYFSYTANGCPLTAIYDVITKNCYFD